MLRQHLNFLIIACVYFSKHIAKAHGPTMYKTWAGSKNAYQVSENGTRLRDHNKNKIYLNIPICIWRENIHICLVTGFLDKDIKWCLFVFLGAGLSFLHYKASCFRFN